MIRACDAGAGASPPPQLYLEAIARVDDSSGLATLYVDGNGVWDLLQLPPRQRAQLEDFSLRMGSFTYTRISREVDKPSEAADLGLVQTQLWERHLREAYPGMQLVVCATQFYMHRTVRQAAERIAKAEAAAAAAAQSAGAPSNGADSMAPAASASPSTSSPSSSIPFDTCSVWKFKLGSLQVDTLMAPPISLRAIDIQPVQVRQQANLILQQLLQE